MAHYRKLLGAAVGLNTAIIVGEAVAGWQANSLSLLMDSMAPQPHRAENLR